MLWVSSDNTYINICAVTLWDQYVLLLPQVFQHNEVKQFVVTSDPVFSNWMHYVQQTVAETAGQHNSLACQLDSNIYFYTVKSIPANSEIVVTYSREYAERITTPPVKDDVMLSWSKWAYYFTVWWDQPFDILNGHSWSGHLSGIIWIYDTT